MDFIRQFLFFFLLAPREIIMDQLPATLAGKADTLLNHDQHFVSSDCWLVFQSILKTIVCDTTMRDTPSNTPRGQVDHHKWPNTHKKEAIIATHCINKKTCHYIVMSVSHSVAIAMIKLQTKQYWKGKIMKISLSTSVYIFFFITTDKVMSRCVSRRHLFSSLHQEYTRMLVSSWLTKGSGASLPLSDWLTTDRWGTTSATCCHQTGEVTPLTLSYWTRHTHQSVYWNLNAF